MESITLINDEKARFVVYNWSVMKGIVYNLLETLSTSIVTTLSKTKTMPKTIYVSNTTQRKILVNKRENLFVWEVTYSTRLIPLFISQEYA